MIIASFDRCDLINALGSDKPAFTIWFAGCSRNCTGCHNQRLRHASAGRPYRVEEVLGIFKEARQDIEYEDVVYLGGEPMDQPFLEMVSLTEKLNKLGMKVWIYTGYTELDPPIMANVHAVKFGAYDINLHQEGRILASSNQWMMIRETKKHGGFRRLTSEQVQEEFGNQERNIAHET